MKRLILSLCTSLSFTFLCFRALQHGSGDIQCAFYRNSVWLGIQWGVLSFRSNRRKQTMKFKRKRSWTATSWLRPIDDFKSSNTFAACVSVECVCVYMRECVRECVSSYLIFLHKMYFQHNWQSVTPGGTSFYSHLCFVFCCSLLIFFIYVTYKAYLGL